MLGIRGSLYHPDDISWARDQGVTVITIDDYYEMGFKKVIEKIYETLHDVPTYLTFDIDGIDSTFAPGTGTPEVGGFNVREAQQIIRHLKNNNEILTIGYGLITKIDKIMQNYEISKSLEEIFFYIDNLNKFMDESEPWNTFKKDPKKAGDDLTVLIEAFRLIGIILQPFIPIASTKILDIINIEKSKRDFTFLNLDNSIKKNHIINSPTPIFPRYEK